MFQALKISSRTTKNISHFFYVLIYSIISRWLDKSLKNTPNPFHSILFFIVYAFPLISFALPEDSKQPMHIVADSSLFNYKTGTDIYEGNVKIDQGTSHLTADKLVTQKNSDHKLISAIAYGIQKLAVYTTIPKQGDLIMNAQAKIITFYPPTSVVVLENDVTVTQGQNNFHGQHIIYNTKDQIVAAPASKNGRATIIIDSKQLE